MDLTTSRVIVALALIGLLLFFLRFWAGVFHESMVHKWRSDGAAHPSMTCAYLCSIIWVFLQIVVVGVLCIIAQAIHNVGNAQ